MKPASEISDLPDAFAVAPAAEREEGRAPSRLNDFYELTKPRMNFLVVVTTMVGYYMAVRDSADWPRLLHTLFGTVLAASAAGTLNQFIERKYDKLMPRTQNRPLPAGRVAPIEALIYGITLGVVGVVYLAIFVNPLTAILGLLTVCSYLFVYTPMKRWTTLNTIVGAVPGALPFVMGWTAVHNAISPQAIVLFCILFMWQMPHFLAIAVLYRRDYAAGGFKMLPVVDQDLGVTSRQMVLYAVALIPVTLMPTLIGMAGAVYFYAALVLGLGFLAFALLAAASRERADARKLFFASIIYLPLLLAVMMMNKLS
jgi:protoheme IX farnesyltransferase